MCTHVLLTFLKNVGRFDFFFNLFQRDFIIRRLLNFKQIKEK